MDWSLPAGIGACADVAGGELVERDGIAEAGPARSGDAGEEAGRGLVPERRTQARVLQTGDDGELIAELFDDFEMR